MITLGETVFGKRVKQAEPRDRRAQARGGGTAETTKKKTPGEKKEKKGREKKKNWFPERKNNDNARIPAEDQVDLQP